MKYFATLPIISYSNNYVRNILTRVKFSEEFKRDASYYYPYVQEEASGSGLRYENLAYDYYDDAEDLWILHLTNDIIDPYYDVTLTQKDFESYIEKKYGSVRKVRQQIKFYRNNYDQDDSIIDPGAYAALPGVLKRYWTPTLNYNNIVIGYERAQDDTVITTNKILSFDITLNTEIQFIKDEKVTQASSGATGFVTFASTSVLTIQHITGEFSNTNVIIGEDSGASATPSAVTTIKQNVSDNELVYFSPVTVYDYELELNEQKKNIKILDNRFKPAIYSRFRELIG